MCLRLEPQGELQWQNRALLRINGGHQRVKDWLSVFTNLYSL